MLLILFVLPNMTFWATPGGGMEPGETPLSAALREVHEELGIAVALEGPVHKSVGVFEFEGELIENTDHFFVGFWDGVPQLSGASETESAALKEARWWTVEEIEQSPDAIFPRDLAAVLRRMSPPGRD